MLPTFHAILAGAWIGTVLIEALFERALLGQGRDKELILARLHWKVDLLVELPLLLAVALTGLIMLGNAPASGLFTAKLALAGAAIAANLWCIWLVKLRLSHAEAGRWNEFATVDHRQHQWGAVVLLGLIGAAGIGLT